MFVLQFLADRFPLVIEQPFLTPQSATVTAQRAIRADDAMTGDDDANHVGAVGTTNRATRVLITELFRHPRIGTRFAHWDGPQDFPCSQLKVRPDRRQWNVELQVLAGKIISQLRTDRVQIPMFARDNVCSQTLS